jgi:glycosyltransferase involved in cell wall biosynthesis
LKYWILTTEFPPQFGGGIGTYCYQWSQILIKQQDEPTVFLLNKSLSGYRETQYEGIRIVEFSAYLDERSSFLGFETSVNLSFEKIISLYIEKEGGPDWIESQEYNGLAYFILQKKHLGYSLYKDVKVVINCHCPSFIAFEFNHVNTYQLPYFWIGEMERFCLKAADICISPSQYLVDTMLKRYPQLGRKFIILKNPYDTKKITSAVGANITEEVVFYGKLSPIKGILELLNAFSQLWEKGHSCSLNLVGDEGYYYHAIGTTMGRYIRDKYEIYIRKRLLKIHGVISPDKLSTILENARFVVVPSTFDNFPYAVLEIMVRQKLVIASDSGGHSEILRHRENGLIYRSGDIEELKRVILEAFELPSDIVTKMVVNAAQSVRIFCDPAEYYNKKIQVLKDYKPGTETGFPFLTTPLAKATFETDLGQRGLLSVVIPFFNMGKYIAETIKSIQASIYRDIEIIIVDDGSYDIESVTELKRLSALPGIRIIQQENKGLARARNTGAAQARGEFLAFLDADDMVNSNYYSFSINIFKEKQNVHFVGCWVKYFGESANSWPAFTPEAPYLLFHNMVNSSGLVYRRQSFVRFGLNDPQFIYGMEDYDSVISLVENGMGGVVIPEQWFMYRVRKGSMARIFNKSNMSYSYRLLADKHKYFYANFAAEITNLLTANGPGYGYENPTLDYHLYPSKSMRNYWVRKIILGIKRQPVLRRIAINLYRRLKLLLL